GREVVPCIRLVEGQSIVHAIPLDDGHILRRRRSLYGNNSSVHGAQGATMGILDSFADAREIVRWECTDQFDLADAVSFQLGLTVQPLHSRCAECGDGKDGQHHLGLCVHDTSPLCRLNQTVRSLAGSGARSYDLRMLVMRETAKRGRSLRSVCSPTARWLPVRPNGKL